MSNLAAIRNQVYALLKQTSGDSQFTDAQINGFINEAQRLLVPIIELPRKHGTAVQVTAGMGDITLPTDNVLILDVYYGDPAVRGSVRKLAVITEQTLSALHPGWLETNTDSRGTPRFFVKRNETTGLLFPRADTNSSTTGKTVILNYVYTPTDLSSDSDSPSFPLPYHDVMKFYVLYLIWMALKEPVLAEQYKTDFFEHHKNIQSGSTKEARETMAWTWAEDDVNVDESMVISFS